MGCSTCHRDVGPSGCVNRACPAFAPVPARTPFKSPRWLGYAVAATVMATALYGLLSPLLRNEPAAREVGYAAAGQLSVAAAVLSLAWIYRAHNNLDSIPGAHPSWSKGWPVVIWLIPVVGVFLGIMPVREIARESAPPGTATRRVLGALGSAWAVGWIASIALNGTAAYVDNPNPLVAAGSVAVVVTGALFSALVVKVGDVQRTRVAAGTPEQVPIPA